MERLSSRGTRWHKIVFPALWLGVFGVVALAVALGATQPTPHPYVRVALPCAWIGGLGLFWWLRFSLTDVWLDAATIRVAGLRHSIEIPLSEIEAVAESIGSSQTITLVLKRATPLGRRIRFVPSWRLREFPSHPTFTRLSELVARTSGVRASGTRLRSGFGVLPPEINALLKDPASANTAAISSLAETHLDELIERLPRDAPLRDLARRERQRRWYGG